MMAKIYKYFFLAFKSNRFYVILFFIFSYQIAQAAKVPYRTNAYGCKIGSTVYWDWLGTSSTSGGVTYYNFNPSGDYSDWLSCWEFEYTEKNQVKLAVLVEQEVIEGGFGMVQQRPAL